VRKEKKRSKPPFARDNTRALRRKGKFHPEGMANTDKKGDDQISRGEGKEVDHEGRKKGRSIQETVRQGRGSAGLSEETSRCAGRGTCDL